MINRSNILVFVAIAAFLAGFGIGCTVGFDVEQTDAFPCESNEDCVDGFECGPNNLCRSLISTNGDGDCVDEDMDGFGVGEGEQLLSCSACRANPADCVPDCDDSNANVNPGAGEICDGVDNDCDGEVDEPSTCESSADCPSEGSDYRTVCENMQCAYTSFRGGPMDPDECKQNFECVGGERESLPAVCQ